MPPLLSILTKELFTESILFLGFIALGMLVLIYLRKKLNKKTTKNTPYDRLMGLSELRNSGQITKVEYQTALKNISEKIKNKSLAK